MKPLRSLGTRLVLVVLATGVVAFTALVGLTLWRLNVGLDRQAEQLGVLSELKLSEKLESESLLARARIEKLFDSSARDLKSITQRADVVRAVSSLNVVAMSELLGEALRTADLDGMLVVDVQRRVIGAHSSDVDLAPTNEALRNHPLFELLGPVVTESSRADPHGTFSVVDLDEDFARAIGVPAANALTMVAVEPVFDDFGDVFAALIGYRSLRTVEPVLDEFSELEGAGVIVAHGDAVVSHAGVTSPTAVASPGDGGGLPMTADGRFWSRCSPLFVSYEICALAPVAELHALRDEMVRIGLVEGRSLAKWLIVAALVSLAGFALVTFLASRRITNPLTRITEAVRAVARGDWKSGVPGGNRRDEIGDIARAVMMVQRSLEERDRLRWDAANAETVLRRRDAMEEAIQRFDRMMRTVLLSVSDCVEAMDETARELARTSSAAEGEAVEAVFVSENTASNVHGVRAATETLSSSIADTLSQIRRTSEGVAASSAAAVGAFEQAERLALAARGLGDVVAAIREINERSDMVALSATMRARLAGGAGDEFELVVDDMRALATQITETHAAATDRADVVMTASQQAVGAIQTVTRALNGIAQQANAIAMTIERQDLVTREIANGISAASDGTTNVAASVERLKATIEEARAASMKVVARATDMIDEAHRLDLTVKSFLREVTA